jgi:translation initiation factor IF-2
MPTKVYDLAKEFKVSNTEMVKTLSKLGYDRLTPSSDLDDDAEAKAREVLASAAAANGNGTAPAAEENGAGAAETPAAGTADDPIELPANLSIKELAERLNVNASEIQKVLMGMGVLAALNQRLAPDAVNRIAQKLGKIVKTAAVPGAPAPVAAPPVATDAAPTPGAKPIVSANKPLAKTGGAGRTSVAVRGKPAQGMVVRPPVVTIMGHVDHGKTTLLDAIRKANVARGEAGGITQHIGAYQVETNGQRITFIDTPGHAAFSAMRQRGASVTDIVVIVVAADDSIMPQTEEAITIAREAGLPIIVAVNKIDLPDSNPERVLTDLTRYEIVPEAFGGDVQTVNLSAKTGEGIPQLLETILLVSEAVVEPKADPHGKAQGTVIEAKTEKGRGAVATVLVQQGTLTVGDVVVAGVNFGKIRTITDDHGGKIQKAGPSTPVEIVGLSGVPEAGDRIEVARDEKDARAIAQRREIKQREERLGERSHVTLEELYRTLRVGAIKELNIVVKGDVQGSVQAVRESLQELGNEEVRARVLSSGVGAISENDILLAASDKDADISNSLVVGFNVGLANGVEKKAEQEHVNVKTFSIIYELIDAVKLAMVGLLDPIYEEVNLGKAEVRALFKLPGGRAIAGSYVQDGVIRRNGKARLFRGKELLYTGDIDTLKRFKDDAREVQTGYECGLTLRDFNEIKEGDIIECFEMRAIPREL